MKNLPLGSQRMSENLLAKGLNNYSAFQVWSQDSSVVIATGYRQDSLISGEGKRFVSDPQHRDQLWGPPSLLSNGYCYNRPKYRV
jgi:hypothetical protein